MLGCESPDLCHWVEEVVEHGGYFVGFTPEQQGGRNDRTSVAAFLDLWLQPDSPTAGLPHFLLPDLLTSPPMKHQLPSIPDQFQFGAAVGRDGTG